MKTLKGAPKRLVGAEFENALRKEAWRGIDRVGELTAIEYRKVSLDRLKTFAQQENLTAEATHKLLKLSEAHWDRIAKAADAKEGSLPPHKVDWSSRRAKFVQAMELDSAGILTAEQLARLKQELDARFDMQLNAATQPKSEP